MEQMIALPGNAKARWLAVRDLLSARGLAVQLRMFDGQLALPEELPPDEWTELRIGTEQGMITVRREPSRLRIVTWGNAGPAMREAWNAVTWAFAQATGGAVEMPEGPVSAEHFRVGAELPARLKE
jgi:hypothetical protein